MEFYPFVKLKNGFCGLENVPRGLNEMWVRSTWMMAGTESVQKAHGGHGRGRKVVHQFTLAAF